LKDRIQNLTFTFHSQFISLDNLPSCYTFQSYTVIQNSPLLPRDFQISREFVYGKRVGRRSIVLPFALSDPLLSRG